MKIQETKWDPQPYGDMDLDAIKVIEEQPQFGASVLWTGPSLFRPCLLVHFWKWRIQIGWMP